jgi:hypothetical protein
MIIIFGIGRDIVIDQILGEKKWLQIYLLYVINDMIVKKHEWCIIVIRKNKYYLELIDNG